MAHNIIKRVFGALKKKFHILTTPIAFSVPTQINIILAVTALWNFI